jgi:hypothetical protein
MHKKTSSTKTVVKTNTIDLHNKLQKTKKLVV